MKKFFNKQVKLASTMVAIMTLLTASLFAANTTVYSIANNKSALLTNLCYSTSFVINNTNLTTDATVTFFDAPNTNLTYSFGAYSNIVVSTAMITNLWTNYFGVVNSNVYTAQIETTNSVAAATNNYSPVYSVRASSNAVTTVNFASRWLLGVMFTNNATVSVTLNYQQ